MTLSDGRPDSTATELLGRAAVHQRVLEDRRVRH